MDKNLFQIAESMTNLVDYHVDDETGEIIDNEADFIKAYEAIKLDLHTKLDNTLSVKKMLDGDIDIIDKEIKRLQAIKKSKQNKTQFLINRVDAFAKSQCMVEKDGIVDVDEEKLHKFKLELPHHKISYAYSTSVEVFDEDGLDKKYKRVTVEEKPDKTKIKQAINDGEVVDGAKIVKSLGIRVK